METVTDIFGVSKSLWMVTAAMKLKDTLFWKETYGKPRQHIKSRDITLLIKVHIVNAIDFSNSHAWMGELDHKEDWASRVDAFKLWCWRRLLRVPLDCKEIQPTHPKGDQSWVFIGRTDAEAETPVLWLLHGKSWLIGKDWCWEGMGAGGKGDDRGWDG